MTPAIDPLDNRRLDVTITKTFNTFFLRTRRDATSHHRHERRPASTPFRSRWAARWRVSGTTPGFWTVVAGQGSDRGNGDAFGDATTTRSRRVNAEYDANGYMYAIDVPVGAGTTSIDLYDPTFCAVDPTRARAIGGSRGTCPDGRRISTYYTLWSDPAETPLDYSDDVQVASTGTLFEHERQVDKSAAYRETSRSWPEQQLLHPPRLHDLRLPQRVVDHCDGRHAGHLSTPGHDDQCRRTRTTRRTRARRTSSGYAPSRPTRSTRLASTAWGGWRSTRTSPTGPSTFYLARIEAVHAGKTMVVRLFDPGDASGTASIQVLKPTSTGYTPATFSYTADANAARVSERDQLTSLTTVQSGDGRYNNSWVTLTIPLPKTYNAPLPPGEPAGTLGGWWKIAYTFNSTATDSTTWRVSIRGNPVHLVQRHRRSPAGSLLRDGTATTPSDYVDASHGSVPGVIHSDTTTDTKPTRTGSRFQTPSREIEYRTTGAARGSS